MRAVQSLHALDHDAVGAGAVDLRAHGDEEIREVDDLGLARGVLEHGLAVGQRRGHHQVLGAGDGHGVEHQARALQARRRARGCSRSRCGSRRPWPAGPATWMFTGRAPMAQPPGSDTSAWPKRASSGPSTRIEARMVFTSS